MPGSGDVPTRAARLKTLSGASRPKLLPSPSSRLLRPRWMSSPPGLPSPRPEPSPASAKADACVAAAKAESHASVTAAPAKAETHASVTAAAAKAKTAATSTAHRGLRRCRNRQREGERRRGRQKYLCIILLSALSARPSRQPPSPQNMGVPGQTGGAFLRQNELGEQKAGQAAWFLLTHCPRRHCGYRGVA